MGESQDGCEVLPQTIPALASGGGELMFSPRAGRQKEHLMLSCFLAIPALAEPQARFSSGGSMEKRGLLLQGCHALRASLLSASCQGDSSNANVSSLTSCTRCPTPQHCSLCYGEGCRSCV